MRCTKSSLFLAILAAVSTLVIAGCETKRTAPHMGFGGVQIETKLSRDDIVVLERVEGTSETESIAFGAIQVIDRDKMKILGIPLFNDRFTCLRENPCLPKTEDRAYYKALEGTPDADAVFYKTMKRETGGIPLIWEKEAVTFSGKAFTIKCDRPDTGPAMEMSSEEQTSREAEETAESETDSQ